MKNHICILFVVILLLLTGCARHGTQVYSGFIEGREIPVRAQVQGEIITIAKKEGDYITPDDLLLKLDDQSLIWQLKETEAVVEGAVIRLLHSESREQEQREKAGAVLQQLTSQLEGAKNSLAYQQKQLEKIEHLYNEKALSEKELDAQRELVNQASAIVNSLNAQHRSALISYQGTLGNYDSDYMNYYVKQAEAKKEQLKVLINNTTIHSPVNGYILRSYVEMGETVKTGTLLFTILDPTVLELNIFMPQQELGLIKAGQEVKVKVDAFPNNLFTGVITRINNKAEFTPKNIQTSDERSKMVFRVSITLLDGHEQLKPGMTADVISLP